MKIFKKCATALTAFGLLATMFFATPVAAEPGQRGRHGDHQQRMEKRLDRMTQELDLTPDQAERIRQLFDAQKEARKSKKGQFKSVLTDEQLAQLEQHRAEMKEKRKANRGERTGKRHHRRGHMKEVMASLNLTDDQKAQLRSMREQAKAEREQFRAEIQSVLTPDQQARFEELKAERKAKRKEWKRQRGGGQEA